MGSCWCFPHGAQSRTHPRTWEGEVFPKCPYPTPSIHWYSPKSASSVAMTPQRQSKLELTFTHECKMDWNLFRAPGCPLECYHGSCYSEAVEVVREAGAISGLRLNLIADGMSHPLFLKMGQVTPPPLPPRFEPFQNQTEGV